MVFSRATGYGIRALSYMARQSESKICRLNEIAATEMIPSVYLRKLLGELRRHRVVESVKGLKGGYILVQKPEEITLWDVFQILDHDPYLDECALCGTRGQDVGCSFCKEWKQICSRITDLMKGKTINDFAKQAKVPYLWP